MEAFFAITLSIYLISKFGRSKPKRTDAQELNRNTVKARWDRKRIKADKQKQKDAELISVILPTINSDK